MQITRPSDRIIVINRSFAAPRLKVFEAFTKADQVLRWFQPKQMALVSYESDLKPGGKYRYVFQRQSGKRVEMRGVFQEVDAPHEWRYTETYDFSPLQLLVKMVLDEMGARTVMSQTIEYPSTEERDGDFDGVSNSAHETYDRLERFLEAAR